jgi:hypothetical protein
VTTTHAKRDARETKREFHNNLRILRCIDRWEVDWMADEQWSAFQNHPWVWVIRCSDADYDRIWSVIEARQPKKADAA